jgi:hypothetical protein
VGKSRWDGVLILLEEIFGPVGKFSVTTMAFFLGQPMLSKFIAIFLSYFDGRSEFVMLVRSN